MDFESILKLVKEYLTSINVRQETINNKISKNNIKSLYFKPLSPADIFKKKAVKGHTTHIAITGASRELFYDEKILNNQKYTSEHHLHNIILFQKNYQIITNKKIYDNEIELINEISSSHIRCIKNQKSQVAFGLKSFSSANFIELREHLYEDDKLIILRDYNDDYYVLAIKKEVQTPLNNLNGIYFFKNSTINLSSSFYVKEKKASYNIPNKLQKTTSELIAQLNKKNIEEYDTFGKNGIQKRLTRYENHQKFLGEISKILEMKDFNLYKGQIDCLGEKAKEITLIIEVKTLNGKRQDEVIQVRNAFSQLKYYEFLYEKLLKNKNKILVAAFDKKPSKKHINFLLKNNIEIVYKSHNKIIIPDSIKRYLL